jgi:hypothetical protein
MKKSIIILGIFFVISIGCEKDNEIFTYSGIYKATKYERDEVRLFTKDEEISGPIEIQGVISSRGNIGPFYDSEIIEYDGDMTIEFLSDSVAIIDYGTLPKNRRIIRIDSYLYFEEEEIKTCYNYDNFNICIIAVPPEFLLHSPNYTSITRIDSSSEYDYKIDFKRCIYTRGRNNIIEIPYITYHYTKDGINGKLLESGSGIINEFDINSIQNFDLNDTLIFQESRVILEKQ